MRSLPIMRPLLATLIVNSNGLFCVKFRCAHIFRKLSEQNTKIDQLFFPMFINGENDDPQ